MHHIRNITLHHIRNITLHHIRNIALHHIRNIALHHIRNIALHHIRNIALHHIRNITLHHIRNITLHHIRNITLHHIRNITLHHIRNITLHHIRNITLHHIRNITLHHIRNITLHHIRNITLHHIRNITLHHIRNITLHHIRNITLHHIRNITLHHIRNITLHHIRNITLHHIRNITLHHIRNITLHHIRNIALHHIRNIALHHIRNITLHHIRNITLHHMRNITLHHMRNIICDITLHKPNDGIGLSVERSIKEWKLGSSAHALVCCKEKFSEEPNHLLYIDEKDRGVSIVRCSGWRNVSNISFVVNPPSLLFDIANTYRENILSLDDIPRQVYVYGETYRLGGLTSFVEIRGNYVGYIFDKDVFLFHDGLPKTKPALKNTLCHKSMLIFHYWYVKTNNNGDKNTNAVMSESSAVDMQTMNQDVDVSDIKATSNDTCKIATCSNANSSTDNDELPTRALSELENENIYKKPVGRSYRKTKNIKTPLSCDADNFKAIDPNPGTRSSPSSSTENILVVTSSAAFVSKKQKYHLLCQY